MPQSASPVGLAWSVCPQNNSIRICSVYNTVVLETEGSKCLDKMRGSDTQQSGMFSYLSPEERVPEKHPLRAIRQMTDEC
jgi:hypothetical protein